MKENTIYCKLCNRKFKNLNALMTHVGRIHKNEINKQTYYEKYYPKYCKRCGILIKYGSSFTASYFKRKYCSKKCANKLVWNKGLNSKIDKRIKNYSNKGSKTQIRNGKNKGDNNPSKRCDVRKKIRIACIKRIELNYGQCWPSYNKKACEFFKKYDEQNNTKGHYAVYGGGEHFIKELGYWPDYINFDKKLIMEWDEKRHHNKNGTLKQKDIIRQQEIKEKYPDFKFIRIKENSL